MDRSIAVWSHYRDQSNLTRVTHTLTFATLEQYRKETVSIEEAIEYLEKFDITNMTHVDKIGRPEAG